MSDPKPDPAPSTEQPDGTPTENPSGSAVDNSGGLAANEVDPELDVIDPTGGEGA